MKQVIVSGLAVSLIFSSCQISKMDSYADDVYSKPTQELLLARKAAEEQARKEAEAKKKAEDERLAQKAKDDANPYYKDPVYSSDDYYDYKYASKLRRYYSPLYGAGYYDNYYTNSYYYNNNASCYGSSIYNSYNWGMPSAQFAGMSYGLSFGNNPYGNYGYNPYGYNSYGMYGGYGYNNYGSYGMSYGNGNCWNSPYYNSWNNGYNGFGYNPYGYSSYGYGYSPYGYGYNPYGYSNNGWGYYNSYDPNSQYSKMAYGPRNSHGGGNSMRTTSPGMAVPEEYKNAERQVFFNDMIKRQEDSPRFTELPHRSAQVKMEDPAMNGGQMSGADPGRNNNNQNGNPSLSNPGSNNNPTRHNTLNEIFGGGSTNQNGSTVNTQTQNGGGTGQPGRQGSSGRISGIQDNNGAANQGNNQNRGFEWPSGGNGGGNSGGTISSPRGGGGGVSRPR